MREEIVIENENSSPWGFWQTIVFSVTAIAVYYLIPLLIVRISSGFEPPTEQEYLQIGKNSFLYTLSIIVSSISALGLVVFFSKLRPGILLKEYFGLNGVSPGTVLKWIIGLLTVLVLVGWAVMDDGGRPYSNNDVLMNYDNTPLVVLAMSITAPAYEEFLYRGFMFKGIEFASGPAMAVLLSSLLFALSHIQYNVFGMYMVFITGLFLGYARVETKSIITPIAMHSALNLFIFIGH